MEFIRRVRAVWSWLPSFRAVAETEHLPTAAAELDVVPSSLSRTVKLLEDEIGVPLFDRSTNALVLNEAGRRLLAATRDAMRIVDEALVTTTGDEMRGSAYAIASPDLAHAVLPRACAIVTNHYPDICASIAVDEDAHVGALLLRGDADVALVVQPPEGTDLEISEVGTWSRSVYARAGSTVDSGSLRCVGVGTPAKPVHDGWPAHLQREIAAWASDERSALEVAARSSLVAVAFDPIARRSDVFKRLIRLPTPHIAPRPLYLVHRKAIGAHRKTVALADAIRESLTRV